MEIFKDITKLPEKIIIDTESESLSSNGGQKIEYEDVCLEYTENTVTLTAQNTGLKSVVFVWNAEFPANSRFLGDAWERGYGDFEWRGFVFDRVMPWYFFALSDNHIAGYGVKTGADAMCSFTCDRRHIELHLDVRCGFEPVKLQGRKLTLCEIVCDETETSDIFAAEQDFLKKIVKKAVFPKEKVYGFNNWYYAYGESSREEILGNAAHLASLSKGLENRPYMVIDDGWQERRYNGYIGGPWRKGKKEFGDMKSLADEIAAMDVIPGIWYRPLQNSDENIPEDWFRDKKEHTLDPSRKEVLDYIRKDVETLTGWGYKLIKYDFSTFDIAGRWGKNIGTEFCSSSIKFSDKTKTTAEIIKNLYKTIYEASGSKAIILGCNCVGHLGAGFMHLNRTGDDTSGRDFSRTRRMGVNTLAFRMPQHGIFYDVDADCVGITADIPWEKNEQWLNLLTFSGTPLFISVDPDLPDEMQNRKIADCLAEASLQAQIAVPLDVLNTTTPEVWQKGGKTVNFEL